MSTSTTNDITISNDHRYEISDANQKLLKKLLTVEKNVLSPDESASMGTEIELLSKHVRDFRYQAKERNNIYTLKCPVCQETLQRWDVCSLCNLSKTNMDRIEFEQYKIRIHDLIDPLCNCVYYMVPSILTVGADNRVKIVSDINNLSRVKHGNLYNLFENVFAKMVPLFEWLLTVKLSFYKDLKVIIKLQDYQLYPQQTYTGHWHSEGYPSESICAVGNYYIHKSSFIETDVFEMKCDTIEHEECKINIESNECVVFSNTETMHRLSALHNGHDTEVSTRKLLTFFLIQPGAKLGEEMKMQVINNRNMILYGYRSQQKLYIINKEDCYRLIIRFWLATHLSHACQQSEYEDVISVILSFDKDLDLLSVWRKRNNLRKQRLSNDNRNQTGSPLRIRGKYRLGRKLGN
eukprot:338040_1